MEKFLLVLPIILILFWIITGTASANSYNRQAAVDYAEKWAMSYNTPKYQELSEDCTNFVSQCIRAGGIDYMWYGDRTSYLPWWHILYADSAYSFTYAPLWFKHFSFVRNVNSTSWITNLYYGDIIQIASSNNRYSAGPDNIFHSRIVVGFGSGPNYPDPNPNGNPYCAQHTSNPSWVRWDLTTYGESIFTAYPNLTLYCWTPKN
jgi:hypothetical protein